jgi:hypothetical protein
MNYLYFLLLLGIFVLLSMIINRSVEFCKKKVMKDSGLGESVRW